MGNNQSEADLQFSDQYGDHIKNNLQKSVSKFYNLSSEAERKSFLTLLKRYQSKTIPTILPILNSQTIEQNDYYQFGCKVKFMYIEQTLRQEIQFRKIKNQRFEERQIINMFDCVLSGLLSFSLARLYHGDIRPSNIFINSLSPSIKQHKIYLISLPLLTNPNALEKSSETKKQNLLYLSPQYLLQIKENRKKPKSYQFNDIFSLGMIALEMASLCKVSEFYDFESLSIDIEKIKQKLYSCQLYYSKQVCKLISQMLEFNTSARIKFMDAYQKLNKMLLNIFNEKSENYKSLQQINPSRNKKKKDKDRDFISSIQQNFKKKCLRHFVTQKILKSSLFISPENQKAFHIFSHFEEIRK